MPTDASSLGSPAAAQNINPEDDVTLQAIEALEARSIDLDPAPFIPVTPPAAPVVPKPAPVPQPKPPVVQPARPTAVVQRVAATAIAAPSQAQPVVKPKQQEKPNLVPTDVVPPKKPKKPAEAIAEELANAPNSTPYRFFVKQKLPAKTLIISTVIAAVILLLGAGAFFYLQIL